MMKKNRLLTAALCLILVVGTVLVSGCGGGDAGSSAGSSAAEASAAKEDAGARAREIAAAMTTEQKIAQMIMPAIRSWEGGAVTDLSERPDLAEALRRHQYCGVILFGQNITGTAQTVRLVSELQENNAAGEDAGEAGVIPYMIAADQEGGSVCRLDMGTRGTGSMAIGATGENAEANAETTGEIFGEELAALGINVNFGPCIDVITDLTDMGMSTRVFSDDPAVSARLGTAFRRGEDKSGVITTFKHFPGAGDGSDWPTSIKLTEKQLREGGLAAYKNVIEGGAEMIMTSATTFPKIDEARVLADGSTKGYYPATLSSFFVTEVLREEFGFDGVVITDALEMEQFVTEPDTQSSLFAGAGGTLEHDVTVAEKAINAGCDILLIPADLNGSSAADYYDSYIDRIAGLVGEGRIDEARIDEAAVRILTAKERHGILDLDTDGSDLDEKIENAKKTVGSEEHHRAEAEIAKQAVTLLKNDRALPLSGSEKRIVIIGRTYLDDRPIRYALENLKGSGVIESGAAIEDRISGETKGDGSSGRIIIDRYYDPDSGELIYPYGLSEAIGGADAVICLSGIGAGTDQIRESSPAVRGVRRALSEARSAGAKFILLSDNLPVDAALFREADAIVCAYLSAGFDLDPLARTSGSTNTGAFNANVPAAIEAIFGAGDMPGRLPINIPELNSGGEPAYGDEILYERGSSAADE